MDIYSKQFFRTKKEEEEIYIYIWKMMYRIDVVQQFYKIIIVTKQKMWFIDREKQNMITNKKERETHTHTFTH